MPFRSLPPIPVALSSVDLRKHSQVGLSIKLTCLGYINCRLAARYTGRALRPTKSSSLQASDSQRHSVSQTVSASTRRRLRHIVPPWFLSAL